MKTRVTSGVLAQAFTSLVTFGFSHLNLCVLPEFRDFVRALGRRVLGWVASTACSLQ